MTWSARNLKCDCGESRLMIDGYATCPIGHEGLRQLDEVEVKEFRKMGLEIKPQTLATAAAGLRGNW